MKIADLHETKRVKANRVFTPETYKENLEIVKKPKSYKAPTDKEYEYWFRKTFKNIIIELLTKDKYYNLDEIALNSKIVNTKTSFFNTAIAL